MRDTETLLHFYAGYYTSMKGYLNVHPQKGYPIIVLLSWTFVWTSTHAGTQLSVLPDTHAGA